MQDAPQGHPASFPLSVVPTDTAALNGVTQDVTRASSFSAHFPVQNMAQSGLFTDGAHWLCRPPQFIVTRHGPVHRYKTTGYFADMSACPAACVRLRQG